MLKCIITFLLFSVVCSAAFAQGEAVPQQSNKKPFVLGVVDEIKSKELSEKRILNIYLPEGYDKDTAHYPVIYLLDGSHDEDFIHVAGIVQFLTTITQAMPNTIVVGIANVDRRRDFTFPTTIDSDRLNYPTTGHSDKFISFLGKELVPYIEKHYRTNSSKTLIGQSLGGLLATEVLLKNPEMFNTYIIVSPSLWWDNESLLKKAAVLIRAKRGIPVKVYITVGGKEEWRMRDDANQLIMELKNHGTPVLNSSIVVMPEEDHLTILHNAVYQALIFLNGKK